MENFTYPVYSTFLKGNEREYVNDCLESGWLSWQGKYIREFEKSFASYLGVKYAATTSSGTTALHLALLALGLGPGDEVIVPTLTYVASVNAIRYTGASPVFVDSLEDTLQMDPDDIQGKITSNTRGILVVHVYGHPCNMKAIKKIARDAGLMIIEDCAEAFGTRCNGQYVGTFGHIAAFSFFANKTITSGEGGMVITNNRSLMERVVRFKGQGLAYKREYWHDIVGYNYRMTNISAAIGLAQLEKAGEVLEKKKKIGLWYRELLLGLPLRFHDAVGDVEHTYWMITILVEEKQRDKLRQWLKNAGIETRPIFYPVHMMPMYNHSYHVFPVAEKISYSGINLPSYPGLSREDVVFISGSVKEFFHHDQ